MGPRRFCVRVGGYERRRSGDGAQSFGCSDVSSCGGAGMSVKTLHTFYSMTLAGSIKVVHTLQSGVCASSSSNTVLTLQPHNENCIPRGFYTGTPQYSQGTLAPDKRYLLAPLAVARNYLSCRHRVLLQYRTCLVGWCVYERYNLHGVHRLGRGGEYFEPRSTATLRATCSVHSHSMRRCDAVRR